MSQEEAIQKRNLVFNNIDIDNNGYIENEEFIRACINPRLFNSYIFNSFSQKMKKSKKIFLNIKKTYIFLYL